MPGTPNSQAKKYFPMTASLKKEYVIRLKPAPQAVS